MIGQPQEITGDKPVALYRLYDEADVLLYVGITHSPHDRFSQHAKDKEWWPEVTRKTVAWCADRKEAEAAECAAIASEKPRHNKAPGIYPPATDLAATVAALRLEVTRLTGKIAALEAAAYTYRRPSSAVPTSDHLVEMVGRITREELDAAYKRDPDWAKKRAEAQARREPTSRPTQQPAKYCAVDGEPLECPDCKPHLFPGHKTQGDHDHQAAQASRA